MRSINLKYRLAILSIIWYNENNGYAAKCNVEFVKKQRKGERNYSRTKFGFTFK